MKNKKTIIWVVILACIFGLLVVCVDLASSEQQKDDGEKMLVGTWKYDKIFDENGQENPNDLSKTLLSVYEGGVAELSLEEAMTVDLSWEYIKQDEERAYYEIRNNGEGDESDIVMEGQIVLATTKKNKDLLGCLCLINDEDAEGTMLTFIKVGDEPTKVLSMVEKAEALADGFQSAIDKEGSEPTTEGERRALEKAYDYLEYTAFSYTGLIEQLEFEGFSNSEATYAADNCEADWNEQAALKAQQYLEYSSFSRSGLIEQLEFEGFTHSQAEYGVTQNGY